jgi:peroxiredoxin
VAVKLLAGLALALVAGLAVAAASVWKVGDTAEDLTLAMADGKEAKLSSWEGDVVLLFFYGTYERHAAKNAKDVDAWRRTRAKQRLVVVGVARDAKAADAKKFGEDHEIGFRQAADPKSAVYDRFATKGLPYVVVLDGKRKIRHSAAGWDEESVETVMADLLGAKDPPPEKKKDDAAGEGGAKK